MVFISLCLVLIVVSGVITYFFGALSTPSLPPHLREHLNIKGVTFQTGIATISVRNIGAVALSISRVTVDDVTKTVLATGGSLTGSGPYDLDPADSGTITISLSWTSGNNYIAAVITTRGNQYHNRATAP